MLFSCVYPFTEVLSEIRRKVTRKSFRCASEPSARGLPCGKRVRWSSLGRRPTDLTRARVCQPPHDNVNSIRQSELLDLSILNFSLMRACRGEDAPLRVG